MQIVIEIPEAEYIATKVLVQSHNIGSANDRVIANGTPLPEHHGDLIDKDAIQEIMIDDGLHFIIWRKGLDMECKINAPTIIPATKEGE